MVRSVFLVNSQQPHTIEKRLRRELEGYGLEMEGPCSDARKSIERIAERVRGRMKSDASKTHLQATMETLAPRYFPGAESCLDVPFILCSPNLEGFNTDTAGAIACSEPTEYEGKVVRQVDIEELTLVGLAVLRRLGIESFYSYLHFDPNNPKVKQARLLGSIANIEVMNNPCIFVPGQEPQLLVFMPPSTMNYPKPGVSAVLEVLDDDSLLSISKLKLAAAHAKTLMKDVAKEYPEFMEEWELRARMVGHLLHQGTSLWSLKEARLSVEVTMMMYDVEDYELESIREIAERKYVQPLTYHNSYILKAADTILCEDAHDIFFGLVERHFDGVDVDIMNLLQNISDHLCAKRLDMYLHLADMMNRHIHPLRECNAGTMVLSC